MNFLSNIFGFGGRNQGTRVFDISLLKMQKAFERMQSEARWDIKKKLVWGYYFLDRDFKKLQKFGKVLKGSKLQTVDIRQVEKSPLFLLHVEEQRIHTADSLFEQCHILAEIADHEKIEVFDGWDVEPGARHT